MCIIRICTWTRHLTLCRHQDQNMRRLFSYCQRSAAHMWGWCPRTDSCWSRWRVSHPRNHPVWRNRYNEGVFLSTNTRSNHLEATQTLNWEIHFSSMLNPTWSGTAWNIWNNIKWERDASVICIIYIKQIINKSWGQSYEKIKLSYLWKGRERLVLIYILLFILQV